MTQNKNKRLTLLEEAKLETTPDSRLRELAASDNAAIRKAVASNPNTPTDILWELGAEFPDQLLANPVWNLLLLENPNLFANMAHYTLKRLLDCETASESFFELISKDSDRRVRIEVASNNNTPANVLEKLATDEDKDIRSEALSTLKSKSEL